MLKLGILSTYAFSATWWMTSSSDGWHLVVRSLCAFGVAYAIFLAFVLLAEQKRLQERRIPNRPPSASMSIDGLVRFHRDNETRH
jgi:hypothetical protein